MALLTNMGALLGSTDVEIKKQNEATTTLESVLNTFYTGRSDK